MTLGPMRSGSEHQTLAAEPALLDDLGAALARSGADGAAIAELDQSIARLDELFLLGVVGEFNSGKSALIDVPVGRQLLAEGVTPATADINILTYGPAKSNQLRPGRTRLSAAIRSQCEAEATRSGKRSASKRELSRHRGDLESLRGRVEALGS